MLSKNLFESALVKPAIDGADELLIITGYSSPRIVHRQVDRLKSLGLKIKIRVLVGMISLDGIDLKSHQGFVTLCQKMGDDFNCRYVRGSSTTHSKNYLWLKKGKPYVGFTGSANYSINAFSGKVIETLTPDEPKEIAILFERIAKESIECTDPQALKIFNIYKTPPKAPVDYRTSDEEIEGLKTVAFQTAGLLSQTLSLLTRYGQVHEGGGLNWQLDRRDKNAAYIPVPADVLRSAFFPEPGIPFKVLWDDGEEMVMVCQGAGGKQLTTPQSNQILGRYLRTRLGLKSGAKVTLSDLKRYGRTDVAFYKKSKNLYYLDFSGN
jgi:hypothetical protein